ncbi:hypothetical protein [Propionicimonas sp.]|uniref:hypothetical protein n=1 Tax=Propionicimonas sp. TaxID=1955623 RepID=UPI00181CB2AE|nr:hypothetical protein [Propionicimonas sp.]MBU3976239.1 hypothetical protein [Actinomycetota bacterium]MBA3021051.1 hypothetical protein [Propionicimonas sp.]MBU3985634.1 hypothetical protein [Actinomycetota bacterium]MBU4008419.1 hypothetical protein [Actinomycetota bacterium]MBU4066431.1 hypothetical protein [Actinomycetota bacterium]
MGRLRWLAGAAGVAMVVAGLGAAYWVGPDDWIDSPAQLVNPSGEEAVVTNYGLLSQSLPMRISASSSAGEVFIGIGHAVDVDDYIATTTTAQVGWFSPAGLMAESRPAQNPALPAAPAGLDFWKARSIGPGTQAVAGDFAGQPVEAVVTTVTGGSAALRVSIGSQLPGAFAISLSLTSVGVVLLVGAPWFRRRQQRQLVGPAEETAEPTHSPLRALRTLTVVLLGCSVLLAGSGCSTEELVGKVPLTPRKELTRDPLDGLDLTALAADYDRRRNAASAAAAAPRYSDREWSTANGELLLAAERFDTAWSRVEKTKAKAATCRTKLGVSYPGIAPHAYPLEVLATRVISCGSEPDRTPVNASVFTRAHSYSPWLEVAVVSAGKPAPPAAGQGEPTIEERRAVEEAAAKVVRYLTSGKVSLELPADLKKWRTNDHKPTYWSTTRWSAWIQRGGIRIGRSDKGVIAVVSILIDDTTTAKPEHSVGWRHPWDQIYRQTGSYRQTTCRHGLMVSIQVSAGQATILSWYSPDYLDS